MCKLGLTYRFLGVEGHLVDGARVAGQLVQNPTGGGVPDVHKSRRHNRDTRHALTGEFTGRTGWVEVKCPFLVGCGVVIIWLHPR